MKKVIFIIVFFIYNCVFSQTQLDSLLKIWNNTTLHDTVRLNAIGIITTAVYGDNNRDSTLYYTQKQLAYATEKKLEKYIANANHILARTYYLKGDYPVSLEYCNKSLKIREKLNDKRGIASTLNLMANIFNSEGNNAKGIEYYTKSLKIRESINDIDGIAGSLNNIGNIYLHIGETSKAIDYYQKALKQSQKSKNKNLEGAINGSLGDAYVKDSNTTEAKKYLYKSLGFYETINNKRDITLALISIGDLHYLENNMDSALFYYKRGMNIASQVEDPLIMSMCLYSISKILKQQNKIQESIIYAENALKCFNKSAYKINSKNISDILYKNYKQIGKYKEALAMHELYIESRDSLLSETNQKEIMRQEFKYNYEKKALTDSITFSNKKKLDDLKHEAEMKVERQQRYALYGGLSMVIIFSLFIFNRFKVTSKQKKVIEFQKHQIVESINYSKKIQHSLLPPISQIHKSIPELFIFYQPKDIVSGDFYWFKDFEQYSIIACVDCTGHGVPGGFMSTLGNLLLDKVISNNTYIQPSEILKNLSNEIIQILHQQDGGEIQDGMDLSLCVIDKKEKKLIFSGARNGIIVISNGATKRYKADLLPVGGNYMKKDKPIERKFKDQIVELGDNDYVFMYTDGFMEQIGGNENLPMNYESFETILSQTVALNENEKRIVFLKQKFDDWRGDNTIDDDVLVIGFRIT